MDPSQSYAGQARGNGHSLLQQNQQTGSADFRNQVTSNGHQPVPVPAAVAVPHARMGNGHHVDGSSGSNNMRSAFPGPRSPPGGKNTSHVPCKFYRQGACQAGKACPFLHADSVGPCKYYQKGNCKFGMRCANEHITADGRRINKPSAFQVGAGALNLGGRVMPSQGAASGSSLLSMQHDHLAQTQPSSSGDDFMNPGSWKKAAYDIPIIDTTFSSHPGSTYGSPPNDGRLAISPAAQNGLSLLEAGLPASFDSQGISVFARTGPIAASVPSRFGLETSPPSSLPSSRHVLESSTLRNLHSSAFGDDGRHGKMNMASSPPVAAEDALGRRIMHSERFSSRSKMLSTSLGARRPLDANDEWDENEEYFTFGEEFLPNALNDLLTPQEKLRRFSRNADDESSHSLRASLSGLGTPNNESNSKVGSPSTSSPSRFGALFNRQQQRPGDGAAADNGLGAFGHVGSPLRPSSLNPGASPSLRALSRPTSGEFGLGLASPPRQASMSIISQQLQRTRLSSRASESSDSPANSMSLHHPGVTRVASTGSSVTPPGRLDRTASTSSGVGVGREKIEEEPELFKMDEVGDGKRESTWKRLSGGNSIWGSSFSKGVGVIGSQRGSGGSGS